MTRNQMRRIFVRLIRADKRLRNTVLMQIEEAMIDSLTNWKRSELADTLLDHWLGKIRPRTPLARRSPEELWDAYLEQNGYMGDSSAERDEWLEKDLKELGILPVTEDDLRFAIGTCDTDGGDFTSNEDGLTAEQALAKARGGHDRDDEARKRELVKLNNALANTDWRVIGAWYHERAEGWDLALERRKK